jgi:hypothetical protein
MAKFRPGQEVWAPIYKYPGGDRAPYALARCYVRSISGRSCEVDLPYEIGTRKIASSLLHAAVGVCIVRIGDFASEQSAMDPICKSILSFLRLLLPDDYVRLIELRTKVELEEFFQINASAYTLWIIVGHGTIAGELCFMSGQKLGSSSLVASLASHAAAPKTFLFLSCHTGRSAFARNFSSSRALCDTLIAPIGELHSAIACQFAQTLLSYFYLEGRQIGVAFNRASERIPTSTRFRLWRRGSFGRGRTQ